MNPPSTSVGSSFAASFQGLSPFLGRVPVLVSVSFEECWSSPKSLKGLLSKNRSGLGWGRIGAAPQPVRFGYIFRRYIYIGACLSNECRTGEHSHEYEALVEDLGAVVHHMGLSYLIHRFDSLAHSVCYLEHPKSILALSRGRVGVIRHILPNTCRAKR